MNKGKLIFWTIAWLLQIVLVGVLLPNGWLEDQINKERQMTADFLGIELLESLVERSDSLFSEAFEQTGIIEGSFAIIPSQQEREQSRGIEDMGSSIWPFVESRIQIFWITVYQGVQRLTAILMWLPYLLPVFVPAVVHGICTREIKKVSYGYASPVVYHSAMHALLALIFLPLFYITAPISIHPSGILVWAISLALVVTLLISNLQKQI